MSKEVLGACRTCKKFTEWTDKDINEDYGIYKGGGGGAGQGVQFPEDVQEPFRKCWEGNYLVHEDKPFEKLKIVKVKLVEVENG